MINKNKLSTLLNLRNDYLTGSKFKEGRRLGIILLFLSFCVLVDFLCFSVSADEIKIHTIVTPIGSQSEKWGAAGLMVCIGGKPINQGGCGENDINGVSIKTPTGTKTIDIKQENCDTASAGEHCNKVIFFIDENNNHEFDDGDTIYEVRGTGGGECPEGFSPFYYDCNAGEDSYGSWSLSTYPPPGTDECGSSSLEPFTCSPTDVKTDCEDWADWIVCCKQATSNHGCLRRVTCRHAKCMICVSED
ncbi:MAG: hypothetical protein DRP75_01150 [Candidatus Omnitrophota bacterium]|nr:MAG: hypothetical protein DRP75_01150 [Candidatus Omnitrophota bacterium]